MDGVIGEILPYALGVAISPVLIIAPILMLFSARAARTGSGFLIGWILGIIVAVGIFTALAEVLATPAVRPRGRRGPRSSSGSCSCCWG